MSDTHQQDLVALLHYPVPDIVNNVGLNYRDALIFSELGLLPNGRRTLLTTINPAEEFLIDAGEIYEHRLPQTVVLSQTDIDLLYISEEQVVFDFLLLELQDFEISMAGGTTISLFSGNGQRGIIDTFIDGDNTTFVGGDGSSLTVGTSTATTGFDIILQFDLTGIPKGVTISTSALALNVTIAAAAGTAAELAVELVRLPYGLPYDLWTLNDLTYDGINPWPDNKYDRSIRVLGAMPTSTGAWAIGDITEFINDSLRRGENYLYLAIRRVQRAANHRTVAVSSSEAVDNALRPSLSITHSPSIAPNTVIVGNRLTIKNPIKHLPKEHRREGNYDLGGENLTITPDGTSKISSSGDDIIVVHDDVNTMKVISTGLDGYGTKRLTSWAGLRGTMTGGHRSPATVINQLAETALSYTGKPGWLMHRAGSIIGLSMIIDINAISGSTITLTMFKDTGGGATIMTGCEAVVATPIVANGQTASATFANGTHTFAAGDVIAAYRRAVGGTRTTDDFVVVVEVEFDN